MENHSLTNLYSFVQALKAVGVEHLVLSPGSRSTPLAITASRQRELQIWTLLDERSAGFFALGLAKGTGRPTALLCTSGTAAANYHPAVMEARYGSVPLLVLTADRPPELRGTGSNQTVDQVRLYGTDVKWFAEAPIPDGSDYLDRALAALAARAVAVAMADPPGPVHLNFPFREPLLPPRPVASPTPVRAAQRFASARRLESSAWEALGPILVDACRPLMVVGAGLEREVSEPILRLAEAWSAPVLADVLSNLRGDSRAAVQIGSADFLASHWSKLGLPSPDVVVRFGSSPTSKAVGRTFLGDAGAMQWVVDSSGRFADEFFTSTHFLETSIENFVDDAMRCLTSGQRSAHRDTSRSGDFAKLRDTWKNQWLHMDEIAETVCRRHLFAGMGTPEFGESATVELTEPQVAVLLAEELSNDVTLVLGNSTPIRDVDVFARQIAAKVVGNRGASGIDGLTSTALGLSASGRRVVLFLGDISFYHDLNGLYAAQSFRLSLTVVLLHNGGGGIFRGLPQATETDVFHLFETPHQLDFSKAAEIYGASFETVGTPSEFRFALHRCMESQGLHILQVRTSAAQAWEQRNAIRTEVGRELQARWS
ncbi:MAG: 2-succinyl-5-enolpyruvyl-6-hydroxy-3-cyclohexene-1-carboxylic-acid synthase [Alicyclobacillaceae bacterium]|jgi:2-succinyl-5-enolpyruvyl-6-hydroxy-3-cyclohexene-1-carboxylate synthase|nr:2-succinyl-5-enolpyruvyl-6-hydroxy-3-cyclohexene-1-carboxylic-acid synthase [Alicyclobacillaceae bacterium]